MDYANFKDARLLLIAALVILVGCVQQAGGVRSEGETFVALAGWKCAPNCRLDITLPNDKKERPKLPREQTTLALEGDKEIEIEGPSANHGKFTLIFEYAALAKWTQQGPGDALYVIELHAGPNRFWALPAGSCPPAGCKYTIVDRSDPTRPPLDPWIILF